MKVLTLHQPWASLVALGVKTIETRSWSTQYRGPLAIHAAAREPDAGMVGPRRVIKGHTEWLVQLPGNFPRPLPLGAIVATCTLVDVVPTDRILFGEADGWRDNRRALVVLESQRPYGDFTPGRYAWLLADVVAVDPPVPFKGGQGLTKTWEAVALSCPEA